MRKMMTWAVLLVAMAGWLPARAQEKDETKKPAAAETRPVHYYRLEFTIRELQDKKVVNTRNYSMIVADNGVMTIQKSGARLPVQTGNGAWQYVDIGVQLRTRIRAEGENPMLVSTIEFSSPALPEQGITSATLAKEQPVLRQANADISAPIIVGKPMVIASMDDPSLPRRFEIEVTPTRLK